MSTVSVAAHDGFGPGLSRAERTRQEKLWRARVRETIKSIPIPDDASVHDVIVCFDAAAEEVNLGRRITTAAALTKPVTPPTRAQGGGVMSPAKVRRSQAEAP